VLPLRRRVRIDGGLPITDARPPRAVGSPRGRWGFALGERVDGLPRGIWVHITDTPDPHWACVAPLPHVLRVIDQPSQVARFRVLYRLALDPVTVDGAGDVTSPWSDCTRGEVLSGRWADRLGIALSADSNVVRATGRALLQLADDATREVRE
jgi:hypothetical protein